MEAAMDAMPRLGATEGLAQRLVIRSGAWTAPTADRAPGNVQANLVILPSALAGDFHRFAQANPRPCPLLDVTRPGETSFAALGEDIDIRTDLPKYRVWRNGELVEQPTDITHLWRDDLVSFAIGCSFSFEAALLAAGIELRHITLGRNVSMYRTSRPCVPAGIFEGPLVVSMRPMTPDNARRAELITARFPQVHGAPVQIGSPEQLGIANLDAPDYGDPVPIHPGEIPVFWACGVTPQAAIAAARPEFCITHAPGCMLVTDLLNTQLEVG
jgi:uncharacterized protein YcsI (UPF0317 family)